MREAHFKIKNGKIEGGPTGYRGGACQPLVEAVKSALGGKVTKEEITEEGCLPEDPLTHQSDQQLLA